MLPFLTERLSLRGCLVVSLGHHLSWGYPCLLLFVVSCFLAGDANGKLTFICTYLNVKQFY